MNRLILKQLEDGAITDMLTKLSLSYTKHYNLKFDRVGPLFQGEFRAKLVENDEQLLHLSRYIHLNPLVSFLTNNLENYPWSSYNEYANGAEGICVKDQVLGFFKSPAEYKQFVLDQEDYAKKLEFIKHKILEDLA